MEKNLLSPIVKFFTFLLLFLLPFISYSQTSTQTFTSNGTFVVPAGVTQITVQAWGAGGGGSRVTQNGGGRRGGGGGGGAYAASIFTIAPGSYSVQVGTGGVFNTDGGISSFNSTTVVADGGKGGLNNSTTAGLGGSIGLSTGTIIYAGGNGANGGGTFSGGGGGAAGTTGPGANASNQTGGNGASLNGGNGANGVSGSVNGNNGSVYGGGGSGGATNSKTDRDGGSGANGLVIITWLTPSVTPEINVQGGSFPTNIPSGNTAISTVDDTDFGSVDVVSGSVTHTFTVQNSGTSSLTVSNITSSHADFTISNIRNSSATGITLPNSYTSDYITFDVVYNSSTPGTGTSTITIVNTDADEFNYTFNVQGVGIFTAYSSVSVSIDWPSKAGENTLEVYTPSGTLLTTVVDPTPQGNSNYVTSVNLGCIEDLNNYYFIMYDSNGNGWDGFDNITITAGGVEMVNQNGDAATVGGTTVYFNVTGGSVGGDIQVSGNSTVIPSGSLVPTPANHTDFGSVDTVSGSVTRIFTIDNVACANLVLSGSPIVAISGTHAADFTVSVLPSTPISSSGTTTFEITYDPSVGGLSEATVTIANNSSDVSETPYEFNIQGLGIAPLTEGPGGITSDLKLWLKTNAGLGYTDGDGVSQWSTQGFGSNATVNTAGQEPTYYDNATNNINFNPVIHFLNDKNNAPEEYDYTVTPQQFLEGSAGFYTQEVFIVSFPDDEVNSTVASMDVFCGDSPLVSPSAKDGSGFGYGRYTVRLDNESITYAIGTTAESTVPADERGYGLGDTNLTSSYNTVNIMNIRDNENSPIDGSQMYYNANSVSTTEVGVPNFINLEDTRFWIGRSQGFRGSYEGRIAEIVTYSARKDNSTERPKIESYLGVKYGITLGVNGTSQDYVDSNGTVIWDIDTGVPANDVFNYDITGIGRDDDSELNQKQSKSVHATPSDEDITIGLVDIESTNNINTNTFSNDRDFLLWGNNNDVLTGISSVEVDMSSGITPAITPDGTKVEFTPMGRKWKVVPKGTSFSAKVSIPEAILTALGSPGDYLMFVSDTPVFDPSAEYSIMSSDGSGNMRTNYTFNSTKYITFGYAPEREFTRSIKFTGGVGLTATSSDDYLDAGDALDLNPNGFTISAWIKRGNSSTDKSIVSKRDAAYSNGGFDFKITSTGKIEMSWKNGGTRTITSNTTIPENVWHQVAVIYNGTNASLYIDGVLDISLPLGAPIVETSNTESFIIGAADGVATTAFFEGNIDEVRVWNAALSEDELRFVMNQEIENNAGIKGSYFQLNGISPTKYDISDGSLNWSNLQGYYPMSTYTFTNSKDASGNGNTAALKNLNTVDYQTAPLPYVSQADSSWDSSTTWVNGDVQTIPGSKSIIDPTVDRDGDSDIDEDDRETIDWNIVQIGSDVTINNTVLPGANNSNRNVLGLIVDNTFELTAEGITTLSTNSNSAGTGNGLTVTHYLGLDGKIDLEGESQLIQTTDSDLVVGANGELERDQQGTGNIYRYNDWSSPVYSIDGVNKMFTVADVLKDGSIHESINPIYPRDISFIVGYDGSVGTPISIAEYWLYVRNAVVDLVNVEPNWDHVKSTDSIQIGAGFLMKGTGSATDQNYVFQGKPNNGDITITVKDDNDYLVGNPYPSAIWADQFIDDNGPSGTNSILGEIYFWDHFGGDSHVLNTYEAGHATYTKMGGVKASNLPAHSNATNDTNAEEKEPGPFIAVGQAFYVNGDISDGGSPNNIVFNNNQRKFVEEFKVVSNDTISIFFKPSKSSKGKNTRKTNVIPLDKRTKFRIGFNAPNGSHRQLLLGFDKRASDAVDYGFDGRIKELNNDDMYWALEENQYVIQATNQYDLESEFPIGIVLKESGLISIEVDALENAVEDTKLYIKDNLTGDTFDITNTPFEITLEAGEYSNRFALTFQPVLIGLNELKLEKGIFIHMNHSTANLEIRKIVDTNILNVSLYNILGQEVQGWSENFEERALYLPVKKLAIGVYIVNITTANGLISKKIIIE